MGKRKQEESPQEVQMQYQVKTTGFMRQFTDLDKAKAEFKKLESKKMNNEESFTLTLSSREGVNDSWTQLEQAKITDSYYEED